MNVACDSQACFTCRVSSDKYFQLDGRDHDSPIDQNFTLEHNGWADSVYWRGFQSSVIVKNTTTRRWEIRDDRTNTVLGRGGFLSFSQQLGLTGDSPYLFRIIPSIINLKKTYYY